LAVQDGQIPGVKPSEKLEINRTYWVRLVTTVIKWWLWNGEKKMLTFTNVVISF
jgi:hypothetical protein